MLECYVQLHPIQSNPTNKKCVFCVDGMFYEQERRQQLSQRMEALMLHMLT